MKKYFILLFACTFCSLYGLSQLVTSLTVNQPPAAISEWANSNTAIVYLVENIGPVAGPRQVVIKTELKTTDGSVVASTDLGKAQVYTLQPGSRIFYAKDVFPLPIMLFTGNYKTTLERTGKLPSGTYQLNVQLVQPGTFTALTPVQSRIFNLVAPQLPYLVMPVNHDTLNAKRSETAITFRWTPLMPRTAEQPYYRLQVFEILPYQQPLQALRGNQPLLDQVVRVQTQFIWRPQISFSVDTIPKRFIWTIQTLNANRIPFVQTNGSGESRSEPFVFFVGIKTQGH